MCSGVRRQPFINRPNVAKSLLPEIPSHLYLLHPKIPYHCVVSPKHNHMQSLADSLSTGPNISNHNNPNPTAISIQPIAKSLPESVIETECAAYRLVHIDFSSDCILFKNFPVHQSRKSDLF